MAAPHGRGKRSAVGGGAPSLAKYMRLTQEYTARGRSSKQPITKTLSPDGGSSEGGQTAGSDREKHAGETLSGKFGGSSGEGVQSGVDERRAEQRGRSVVANRQLTSEGESAEPSQKLDAPQRGAATVSIGDAILGQTGPLPDSNWAEVDEEESPSDTLAATQLLRTQFPKLRKKVEIPPFALKTQVYSIVRNRTDVDRELEVLKRRRKIRLFKLVTSGDDYAIMLWDDYVAQVRQAQVQAATKSPPDHLLVFDWFVERVLPGHVDVGISHAQLWRLLSGPGRPGVREYHVSLLLQAGLLVRQLADTTAFWFAMPNIGLVIKSLVQGRKELVGLLSRRKYREMLQAELSKRNLRYSILGMRFHLRDLLGSGKATTMSTTVGPVVRLARE